MVSLTEVKELLRIPYDDEDGFIQAIIDAGYIITRYMEAMRALLSWQTTSSKHNGVLQRLMIGKACWLAVFN